MNSRNQSYVVYLLLGVAIIAMFIFQFNSQGSGQGVLSINEVVSEITRGNVTRIVEDDNTLKITLKDGSQTSSTIESNSTLVEQLLQLGVTTEQLASDKIKIEIKPPSPWMGILTIIGYVLPFLI